MSIFAQAIAPYQNATSTIKNPKKWFLDAIGGKTGSGINVTERNALTLSAYYDGVNLISNHVGYLPFHVILRNPETGNRTKQTGHKVRQLMQWEANRSKYGGMSAFTFKKTMTMHMLNWGDAYAIIHKRMGEIDELELIEPWNTRIMKDRTTKSIFYKFKDYDNPFPARDVLHLHQFSLDGIKGKSIIEAGARERFGGHIAAATYGEAFFGNGTHMGGILISEDSLGHDPDVVNEAKSEVRQELDNVYGSHEKWHRIGILDGKWEYKNMTLKASDAQLIERSEATVEDVARWLGVPTAKLKSQQNTAYNTREHEAIDYVQDGLIPRTTIWEQETRRKLLTGTEKANGMETSINEKDLMRGDLRAMAEFIRNMVDRGVFTPNEALEFMGEDTYPDGDIHLMPSNFTTIERFLEGGDEDPVENLKRAIKEIANNKTNGHHEADII